MTMNKNISRSSNSKRCLARMASINLAHCHFLNKRWIEAAESYAACIRGQWSSHGERDQQKLLTSVQLHRLLSRALLGIPSPSKAISVVCKAIHLLPASSSLWCDMAVILAFCLHSTCSRPTHILHWPLKQ